MGIGVGGPAMACLLGVKRGHEELTVRSWPSRQALKLVARFCRFLPAVHFTLDFFSAFSHGDFLLSCNFRTVSGLKWKREIIRVGELYLRASYCHSSSCVSRLCLHCGFGC